ncbi:putative G-protein coupled receptor 158 isoform X1 [Huso huso]|uniref:G-protein coupled receptor 158 isoform X1 n=1 Tax=Huso huso TaxID=61971 RepID=A0ABR0ZZN1_HUSHU
MAVFLLSLLLQVQIGFVIGSNHGFDGRAVHHREKTIKGKQPIYNSHMNNPEYQQYMSYLMKSTTDRPVLAQKIEGDLPRVATAFLHTGDSSKLKNVNCSKGYELGSLRGMSHTASHSSLHSALDTVLHATNFLNMILQANRSREKNLRGDIEWYHALVRSILEGDPKIQRAMVTFNEEPVSSGPHVLLQATRTDSEIVLQDLSSTAHRLRNKTLETEWFNEFKSRRKPHLHRRVLIHDIASLDASLRRGDSYVVDKTHIKWSAPYLECQNGNFIPHWLLTLSAGFYGLRPNLIPEFRGVVRVDINLQDVDIDQCSSDGWFAGTHRCHLNSTECKPIKGLGFVLDAYQCVCRHGFYHPSRLSVNGYTKKAKENPVSGSPYEEELSDGVHECLPCRAGCSYCTDESPCYAQEDGYLRISILSFHAVCMLMDFISMLVVYHFRRNKSIRASGLVLLETILFGGLLLYFPVIILYFPPSIFRCILLRWVRLLGFAIVYGTVTLKLFRVLKVFLSRTAQRIPYMTSWRVLRMLAVILLIVCWFLISWTSAVCQNMDRNVSFIVDGRTSDNLQFKRCLLDRWDYMMAIAEFLFLLWGVYLCYAVRTVPSAFHEPRYMAVAVHNELIISAIFHIIRFTVASTLHPDWMLMLFFAHTHLTVTASLGLLLLPKFLLARTNPRDDTAAEAYEDDLDLGRSGSYLNSSIASAWSEHSLDPDDIRTPDEMGQLSSSNGCGVRSCDSLLEKRTNEELKKLYSQLEIYKRKKMVANNPHLQKKRSSKKGLGRTIMRRITEIPETVSRQCSREDKELGDHTSARNSISTLRRNPFDPAHSSTKTKEESLKSKAFSIKKSHSSYDHVRDQSEDSSSPATEKMEVSNTESSLLDTLMGKGKQEKKSTENIEAESTESLPLVCKSASAHNLTADKKPLHPRTSMLQKSLSVIASAKERTLGLTGKAPSLEENSRQQKSQQKGRESNKPHSEKSDHQQKNVASQAEEAKKSNKQGIMKPQGSSSQPSLSPDPGKTGSKDQFDVAEVCPWEVQDLPPTPPENKVQKHVSIAPMESASAHGSHAKGKSQNKQKATENSSSQIKPSTQKNLDKSEICPWDFEEPQNLIEGSKPLANHQFVPPLSKGEHSSKAQKAEICPWEFEEMVARGVEARQPESDKIKQGGQKKNAFPVEGEELLSDASKSNSSSQMPTPKKAEVCPWDYDTELSPNSDTIAAPTAFLKTKDTTQKKKGLFSISKDKERGRDRDDEKGKAKSREKAVFTKGTQKPVSQSKLAEVCPWETESCLDTSTQERKSTLNELSAAKSKQADICPWEIEGIPDTKELDRNTCREKLNPNSKGGAAGQTRLAEVCPWDFDDQTTGNNA